MDLINGGTSSGLVCAMGMGIVFLGLICIVLILVLMSAIVRCFAKNEPTEPTKPAPVASAVPQPAVIANKGEFTAAVAAAIAEDLGTDVSGIRILSITKM